MPDFRKLGEAWEALAKRPFVCWEAAEVSRRILGGVRYGYFSEDNPTAELGRNEGGHDFLVVDDEWLVDFWAAAYYQERPIFNLKKDAAEIARLYGDRRKWQESEGETDGESATVHNNDTPT